MRWLRFFAMLAAVGTATGCTLDADGSGSLNVRSVFAQDRTTAEFRWDGPVAPGGAVLRAEMRAQGHFMDQRYFALDAPVSIRPPVDAEDP